MKLIFVLATIVLIGNTGCGQKLNENEIPAAVRSAMQSLYPDVKKTDWEMENNYYEAEFTQSKTEVSVLFSENGAVYQTETEIQISELPPAVQTYLQQEVLGEKIKEAAKIVFADGSINYEAECNGQDYLFDAIGKYIGIETESDNSNDDED